MYHVYIDAGFETLTVSEAMIWSEDGTASDMACSVTLVNRSDVKKYQNDVEEVRVYPDEAAVLVAIYNLKGTDFITEPMVNLWNKYFGTTTFRME